MSTLTLSHTHEGGTLLHGSSKGDGVLEVLRGRPGGAYWKWSRNIDGGAFYIPRSRDQRPKLRLIEAAAEALRAAGFDVELDVDGASRPTAEVVEGKRERAAERADRFEDRAERRHGEADAAAARGDQLRDAIPFGQPILTDHYSATRHRKHLERMHAADVRSWEARAAARYAEQRADASRRAASGKEARSTVENRIKKAAADVARDLRTLHGWFGRWHRSHDVEWRPDPAGGRYHYVPRPVDPDSRYGVELAARIAENTDARIYWTDVLAAMTPAGAATADSVRKGDLVNYRGTWYPVVRVNKKSVTIGGWLGVATLEWRADWSEIGGHRPAASEAPAPVELDGDPEAGVPSLCRHCGQRIEPDPDNGWRHSVDDVVGCGREAGRVPDDTSRAEAEELYASPVDLDAVGGAR